MSTSEPTYKIIRDGDEKTFENEREFRDMVDLLKERGEEFETEMGSVEPATDSGETANESAEVVESEETAEPNEPEVVEQDSDVEDVTAKEPEVINAPEELSQDPIAWLRSHNSEFVNTIKGTPAISKQGFRFIQAQFGITTESDVVATFDDPMGVIVWAKAELPDGQSAEAHGEGWLHETKVDDNELVRYADTRAKNRAISDLTSAGALAVSEVTEK